MKKRTAFIVALLSVLPVYFCLFSQGQPTQTAGSMRAVSLRVLQSRAAQSSSELTNELRYLCGLTIISGYVTDHDSKDMILFGHVDTTRPRLHTEDLAVALRNASHKYLKVQGNSRSYHNPGCSIDPQPAVLKELQVTAASILHDNKVAAGEIDRWKTVCGRPQTVRLYGIPFETHFSSLLVAADYFMKRLADGSESLGLQSLSSVLDMTLAKASEEIIRDGRTSVPMQSINRFWFYPGPNKYSIDTGIIELAQCPVILLTEQEYIERGKIAGTGSTSPEAQKFAEAFSAHYQDVAARKPIYQELAGLFRFVALAKIAIFQEAAADLQYLLNGFPLSKVSVPATLPGVSNLMQFEHKWQTPGGYRSLHLYLPSCGGVDIGINVTSSDFTNDRTGRLAAIRRSLLSARSSPSSLYWDFDPGLEPPLQPATESR